MLHSVYVQVIPNVIILVFGLHLRRPETAFSQWSLLKYSDLSVFDGIGCFGSAETTQLLVDSTETYCDY